MRSKISRNTLTKEAIDASPKLGFKGGLKNRVKFYLKKKGKVVRVARAAFKTILSDHKVDPLYSEF